MNIKKIVCNKLFGRNKYLAMQGLNFGNNCQFADSVDFGSEPYLITIGDNFYSSDNVVFATHDGSVNVLRNYYSDLKFVDKILPIVIGNNVFIGHSSLILPGAVISDNVIVGANSVVVNALDRAGVYAGSPARYICSLDDYRDKNQKYFHPTKGLDLIAKTAYYKELFKK